MSLKIHWPTSLADWPNCRTPDCPNKARTWSLLPWFCFQCGGRKLGLSAMIARYDETHGGPGAWLRDR
jgi:hypothetical protein